MKFYQSQMSSQNEEHYDYIILGTGLVETSLSYLLSKNQEVKVLHLDKNSTYGSEFSTFNYKQLEAYFIIDAKSSDQLFTSLSLDFNVDLTPKLILRESKLKDFLLECKIDEITSFGSIAGSYLFTDKIHHIPINEKDAFKSSLISLMEKYKMMKFFWSVRSYYNGKEMHFKKTMQDQFLSFGLNQASIELIGHTMALNLNDDYLTRHPQVTYEKIKNYILSISKYEDVTSPYVYPIYGLSEICQSFARKSSVNGTIFMLNAKVEKIENNFLEVIDPDGSKHLFKAGKIISDPRYFEDSKIAKEIIRCIIILKCEQRKSRNIVFLKSHLNRKNDIFCLFLGNEENACPSDYEVGIISTIKETHDPYNEIIPVLKNFTVLKCFIETRKLYVNEDKEDIIFTKNVDESVCMDSIYEDMISILEKLNIK